MLPQRSDHCRRIAIAPMMNCTDRHCRYFFRLLSKHVWLYSEMIVDQAIIHGDADRFLACIFRINQQIAC